MLRVPEDVIGRASLENAAVPHHEHLVTQLGDHGEVVRDEDEGDAEISTQRIQEIDDRRLDRHVEGRYGLIADENSWLRREGARNRDPLPLPTRQLVRPPALERDVEADTLEQLPDARGGFFGRPAASVASQPLGHDAGHRVSRIE